MARDWNREQDNTPGNVYAPDNTSSTGPLFLYTKYCNTYYGRPLDMHMYYNSVEYCTTSAFMNMHMVYIVLCIILTYIQWRQKRRGHEEKGLNSRPFPPDVLEGVKVTFNPAYTMYDDKKERLPWVPKHNVTNRTRIYVPRLWTLVY